MKLAPVRLAIAQINVAVGDISGNANKILAYANEAKAQGASLLITPELALCGYPPEDLLFRDDFNLACEQALVYLCEHLGNIALLVGHPQRSNGQLFNAASLIENGRIVATYHKQFLPNYSVFDEQRYFKTGSKPLVFQHAGVNLGVLICEDAWMAAPAMQAKDAGAQFLLILNASPYHINKLESRADTMRSRVQETGIGLLYANLIGGQDELVFDGASFVMDQHGHITQQLNAYEETLSMVDFTDHIPQLTSLPAPLSSEAQIYGALKLALADYVNKNNFPDVVLGLSGGIDSALTLAIAVDALGANRVKVVMMSSEFTANMSVDDAIEMANNVGVEYSQIPIKSLFSLFCKTLEPEFADLTADTTEENLQARIRGTLLMALSNKFGSMVVTTGNKSEMAVGYSTLYGDMAGGFALLKDIPKTLVYQLANYRNSLSAIIPQRIISRPPSAELRHAQTDQDSLPPYEILDPIMQAYVENDFSRPAIVALGFSEHDVNRVCNLIDRNEYKRRQSPVGVRITQKGFGKDRRYPITCKLLFDL